jgi:hypothetical protein
VLTGSGKTAELALLSEVSRVRSQQRQRYQHTALADFFAGRVRACRPGDRDINVARRA